jgi:threonine/homoserine/homoserine lactone efflux protein
MEMFLNGYVLGFAIAAPVGPIGLLCIRRTLASGMPAGLATGLGAATADGLYGAVAALGLTTVSAFLSDQAVWLRLLGGLFLLYLGVRAFMSARRTAPERNAGQIDGLAGAYGSTLLLTISNPATIISFSVVFATFRLASGGPSLLPAAAVVLGVFLGSFCWWLLLSAIVGLLRSSLSDNVIRWINRGSGIMLAGFGVVALLSLAA